MNDIFKKLNYKEPNEIFILNPPKSFLPEIESMENLTIIKDKLKRTSKIKFILAFVTNQKEIDNTVPKISDLLENDAVLWFAYPKGTSKNYKCDFNRDTGWKILGKYGYEGVRMISIDSDWSALRFRKAANIQNMKRRKSMAMSVEGKNKTIGY